MLMCTLTILVFIYTAELICANNVACDLKKDHFRVKASNGTKYFYKCQLMLNERPTSRRGEWRRYRCTGEDCSSNNTVSEITGSFSADVNANDFEDANHVVFDSSDKHAPAAPCEIVGVPYTGASCCVSKTHYLEGDPADIRLFLKCVPLAEGSDWGVWMKLECPENLAFNVLTQNCEEAFGATAVTTFGDLDNTPPKQWQCLDGLAPVGPCANDESCQAHFECTEFQDDSKMCCRSKPTIANTRQQFVATPTCPGLRPAQITIVTCSVNRKCPDGYFCFESASICCPKSLALCPDASLALSISCTSSSQCPTGYYCPFGIAACCELTLAQTCPDGNAAIGTCVAGQCGVGFSCFLDHNLCCTPKVCPDGSSAMLTSCTSDTQCAENFYCPIPLGFCCQRGQLVFEFVTQPALAQPAVKPHVQPTTAHPQQLSSLCPDASQPAGLCINQLCGNGFTCILKYNICCLASSLQINSHGLCLNGQMSNGRCFRGTCPLGFVCTTGNLCCSQAPLISKAAKCPGMPSKPSETCFATLTCTSQDDVCVDGQFCCPRSLQVQFSINNPPTVDKQHSEPSVCYSSIGPCMNSLCPAGYTCKQNIGQCCKENSSSLETMLSSGRPEIKCRNGMQPVGRCYKDLCPPFYNCEVENKICCLISPRSSQTAVQQTRVGAPGTRCSSHFSSICNGFNEGLAACVQGTCTCLPPAKSVGDVCVIQIGVVSTNVDSAIHVDENFSDDFNSSTKRDLRKCGSDSDCNTHRHEKCYDNICTSAKQISQKCKEQIECQVHCKVSSCVVDSNGVAQCKCPLGTFAYGGLCLMNCPRGTTGDVENGSCVEMDFPHNLDETRLFLQEIRKENLC